MVGHLSEGAEGTQRDRHLENFLGRDIRNLGKFYATMILEYLKRKNDVI